MFPLIRGIPPDLSVFSLCLSCLLSPLPLEKTVVQEYSAFAWRIETCDLDNGHLSCQIFFIQLRHRFLDAYASLLLALSLSQ